MPLNFFFGVVPLLCDGVLSVAVGAQDSALGDFPLERSR
jgi:hypothetical protein